MRLRRAEESDCRRLWEWANDREVRSVSFSQDQIPWVSHVAWFDRKLADPNCVLLIAENEDGEAIGQVRFDREGSDAVISISLDARHRGRGYGVRMLSQACRESGAQLVHAYIKPGNEASVRAFEGAGFVRAGMTQVSGTEALHFIYRSRPAGEKA